VKLAALDQCTNMAKLFDTDTEKAEHVLTAVNSRLEDPSWKVRCALAKQLAGLSDVLGGEIVASDMVQALATLMEDSEAEVCFHATKSLTRMVDLVPGDKWTELVVPAVHAVAGSGVEKVRAAVAEELMALASKGPLHSFLLPLVQQFLQDDAMDVRLHVLQKVSDPEVYARLAQGQGNMQEEERQQLVQELVQTIVFSFGVGGEAQQCTYWRLRAEVVHALPAIVGGVTPQGDAGAYFCDKNLSGSSLLDLWEESLSDLVAEVRTAAIDTLGKLIPVLGAKLVAEKMLPVLEALYNESPSYLLQVSVLRACVKLVNGDVAVPAALKLLLRGSENPVSNVKFTVAQCLEESIPFLQAAQQEEARNALQRMVTEDPDADVQFFAECALQKLA